MTPFLDYDLPPELIAQEPCTPRDHARLLVARRREGALEHRRFFDLPNLLMPSDLLVLNDTRVVPARLVGRRARTGGKWEGLYLRTLENDDWEIICQTRGRLREGEAIILEPGPLELEFIAKLPGGAWQVKAKAKGPAEDLLARHGHVPLPPYIRRGEARGEDIKRYQTVYARQPGAVAAPTAGLHFTPELFERLKAREIDRTFITLHVGLGTFRPLESADYPTHPMHAECGEMTQAAVAAIEGCRRRGGRIVAVGTTAARVLETAARTEPLQGWQGSTNLFIFPPYRFRLVDALITNFHLPRTTLLLLVNAFAGPSLTGQAYRAAIEHSYRFYSYGDAMLIE